MLKQGGKEVKEHDQSIEFPKVCGLFQKKKKITRSQWFYWWNFFLTVSGQSYKEDGIQREVHREKKACLPQRQEIIVVTLLGCLSRR